MLEIDCFSFWGLSERPSPRKIGVGGFGGLYERSEISSYLKLEKVKGVCNYCVSNGKSLPDGLSIPNDDYSK